MTPITKITYRVSVVLTVSALICIAFGLFIPASILGTGAAINLIAGAMLKKY